MVLGEPDGILNSVDHRIKELTSDKIFLLHLLSLLPSPVHLYLFLIIKFSFLQLIICIYLYNEDNENLMYKFTYLTGLLYCFLVWVIFL